MSKVCQALKYGCQFAFHYLQAAYFYHLRKFLYPCFQKASVLFSHTLIKTKFNYLQAG